MLESLSKAEITMFAEFMGQKKILIADASPASRSSIAKGVKELGSRMSNIQMVQTYEEAAEAMDKFQPQIIFSEYNLGTHCGLKLVERQRKFFPEPKDTLFILITGNTGESAIAEAAEEDVDSYILKPFTMEIFFDHVIKATVQKLKPTPYRKQLEAGKACLISEPEKAKQVFEEAIKLSPKPVLAYYYKGQAHLVTEQYDSAEDSYKKGLELHTNHYRCMTGLFELRLKLDRLKDAYETGREISKIFPMSPQKLDQILRLAVKTSTFEDIAFYYEIFRKLDYRTPELVRCMIAALVVGGKFQLAIYKEAKAKDLFKKAVVSSGRNPMILKEVVTALFEKGALSSAEEFLKEYPPTHFNDPTYQTMDLAIFDAQGGNVSRVVERARKLIDSSVHEPLVYEIVVRRSIEANLKSSADDYAAEAIKRWPSKKELFHKLLEAKPPKPEEEGDPEPDPDYESQD